MPLCDSPSLFSSRHMKCRFITLLVLCCTVFGAQIGIMAEERWGQTIKSDVIHSTSVVGGYFLEPLDWDRNRWAAAGGIAGVTVLAMAADTPVRSWVRSRRGEGNAPVFQYGRWVGEGEHILLIAGGLYGFGLFADYQKMRSTGRMLMEAMATAGITSTLIKVIIGRSRPYTGEGAGMFRPFSLKISRRSLPSGHSTVGWLTAGVLADQTESTLLDIFWYTTASIVSLSRIYHDKHWFSDTMLGGIIGYTAARYVTNRSSDSPLAFGVGRLRLGRGSVTCLRVELGL